MTHDMNGKPVRGPKRPRDFSPEDYKRLDRVLPDVAEVIRAYRAFGGTLLCAPACQVLFSGCTCGRIKLHAALERLTS